MILYYDFSFNFICFTIPYKVEYNSIYFLIRSSGTCNKEEISANFEIPNALTIRTLPVKDSIRAFHQCSCFISWSILSSKFAFSHAFSL